MMSIFTARETYVGRTDDPQSATFRALAWSAEDDDRAAEPLPYTGEHYSGPVVSVLADAAEPPFETRDRRSTLLYGIVMGFAAAAIGGLLLTVMNTVNAPATTSVKVTQPVVSAVSPPSKAEAPSRVRQMIRSSVPTQANASIPPARAIAPTGSPQPPVAAPAPESQTPVAPEAVTPEAVVPAVAASPEPASAAPEFTPPGTLPPVLDPPIVSLPEVTPQQVPHRVVPPTFHVPTKQYEGITLPPVNSVGAAGAAGGVTLNPIVTLPPMIPTLSVGGGQ